MQKKITELQGRIDKIERNIIRSTYTDQNILETISEIHEQIKDRSRRYTPSELMDLEIENLKRIRESIQSRYYGNFYSPLLAALESAIMPSVDQEFDSRNVVTANESHEVILAEKLAKKDDKTTPKANVTTLEFLKKAQKVGMKISEKDFYSTPSTIEKKQKDDTKRWMHLKTPFRTDQQLDVFQELFLLNSVNAELSRRERESAKERNIERVERKLEELEQTIKDVERMHDKVSVAKELKQK